MTVNVRLLQEHDLPAAARLYVEMFNAEPWNVQLTFSTAVTRLQDTFNTPGAFGFVAGPENPVGVLIGYVEQWYDGRHFYLKELFVALEGQRSGIGTGLMHRLEVILTEPGIDHIYLPTEDSGLAADFYTKRVYYRSPKTTLMAYRLR